NLDRKLESLERRQRNLQNREGDLEEARSSLATLEDERRAELERLSNLTVGEAREMLLAQIEREIRDEANRRLREIEQEVKEEADQRARKIIAVTMQRLTSEVVSEGTVSVVPLPSEDMKGRIIGREGRNIRSLEHLTGVDVIIDDTPDAVTLSAIDHEVEGTHAILGAELARRYSVHAGVIHCIEAHHEEVEPTSVEALITIVADAISGSRPGARRESLDQYVKRLEALEAVANGF